jgi:hypothetical protein
MLKRIRDASHSLSGTTIPGTISVSSDVSLIDPKETNGAD